MDAVELRTAVAQFQARLASTTTQSPEGGTVTAEAPPRRSLAQRLYDLFGGGSRPDLRRALYARVERAVTTHGKYAETLVREACTQARAARQPGNYFSAAIVRKLREADLLEELP